MEAPDVTKSSKEVNGEWPPLDVPNNVDGQQTSSLDGSRPARITGLCPVHAAANDDTAKENEETSKPKAPPKSKKGSKPKWVPLRVEPVEDYRRRHSRDARPFRLVNIYGDNTDDSRKSDDRRESSERISSRKAWDYSSEYGSFQDRVQYHMKTIYFPISAVPAFNGSMSASQVNGPMSTSQVNGPMSTSQVNGQMPAVAVYGSPAATPFYPAQFWAPSTYSQPLRAQIEYYFTEVNLQRDFFLRRRMNAQGFVPLSVIANFPRVRSLSENILEILEAIKTSPMLEVSEDSARGFQVRTRVNPECWPIHDALSTEFHANIAAANSVAPNGSVQGSTSVAPTVTPEKDMEEPQMEGTNEVPN